MPKFLAPADFNKNEIRNVVIQNLASDPSSPGTGQIYTNTSGTPVLKYWNGTSWVTIGSSTGVTAVTNADGTITVAGTTSVTVSIATGGITNSHINSAAAIAYSKLNLASSIVNTDISASAAIAFAKLAAPVATFSFGSQILTGLATPINPSDAATKGYVDGLIQGLSPKNAAIAASVGANVSLTSAPSTLDGVTLASGNRILLKDQTTPSQNGIYVFTSAGTALTRSTDMNAWSEVPSAYLWVEEGSTNADTAFVCTSDPGGTLETTAITFVKFANSALMTASSPLTISGNNLTLSSTLTRPYINATGFYSAVGSGTGTTLTITQATHGLGSSANSYCDLQVVVYDISSNPAAWVFPDITINTSTGDVTATFATSSTLSNYRMTIIGK